MSLDIGSYNSYKRNVGRVYNTIYIKRLFYPYKPKPYKGYRLKEYREFV